MTGRAALVPFDSLFPVLDLLRSVGPITRSELVRATGLTRKVVSQRVDELIAAGFAEESGMGPSTGGRAPREVRFRPGEAHVLVAELASTSMTVGIADLGGSVIAQAHEAAGVVAGPDAAIDHVEELFDELLAARPPGSPPVWGVGIGVPGPVATATGRPVGALSIPEWAQYPVRERLAARYDVPVWVENDANLMALGELRAGIARTHRDVLFIEIADGIGGAVVASGELHRGALGFAGEFGHIVVDPAVTERCWCGRTGCLTQVAGGRALARQGQLAAREGRSRILAAIAAQGRRISAREVFTAAAAGDPVSAQILTRAGEHLGAVTAVLVSAFNPSLVLVDAGFVSIDDPLVAAFRATVLDRCLPAAGGLQFAVSPLGNSAGLIGAAFTVVDALFSARHLDQWCAQGSPVGLADVIHKNP
ncbi:ROK family transcriptional regulator [Pseudonocardia lacus]|uniref:ROK family transcriptional regulator n=1 Tax=Pseudonocardia lacus TaxID=2835865 RepID=UPI0027E35C03|nr:ROK family transcriptional regulator [Pseudonocardia lacus]